MAPSDPTRADPASWHREVAGTFTERVLATADWDAPSPVKEWTARDVVGHLTSWLPGFLASGGVTIPAGTSDPVASWLTQRDAVQALLDDPGLAAAPFSHPRLPPGQSLAQTLSSFYVADVFMHTWDLARATGQDDRLDPATCQELVTGMEPLDEMLRASGQYGPKVPVPDEADPQTRLIAFIGRDPDWRP